MKNKTARRITRTKVVINVILSVLFLLPLYWTVVTALKGRQEIYETPPSLFPKKVSFDNFIRIFTLDDGLYRRYFYNTVIITVISVIAIVAVSALAGYGLSKLKLKGKGIMLMSIMAAIMIPFQALLNPLYITMSKLHLLNTMTSMILIYTAFRSPFCIFMMKLAFDMIPDSLLESAQLDGAGIFKVFWKICLPFTWPSLATCAVYAAYNTWNDYIVALVFGNSNTIKTFNVGLTNLSISEYGTDWGLLTASSLVGLIPILALFVFLQKYFIKGMLSGAVK